MEEEERGGPAARLLETSWSPEKIFPRSGNNSTNISIQQILSGGLAGFDNSGSPVWILPIGTVDIQGRNCFLLGSRDWCWRPGLLACVSKDEILDYCLRMVETSLKLMREKSASLGHPVLYHVVIIDMFGLNLQVRTINWSSSRKLVLVGLHSASADENCPDIPVSLWRFVGLQNDKIWWSVLFEEHYPHTLKSVHILNTSPVMKTVFRITKVTLYTK